MLMLVQLLKIKVQHRLRGLRWRVRLAVYLGACMQRRRLSSLTS